MKRVHAYAERLRFLPHLDDDERYLYAWTLAATPAERWDRHNATVQWVRSARPWQPKK